MLISSELSEIVKVVDVIGPINSADAADTYASAWIDVGLYDRLMFVVSVGEVNAELTAALYENTDANLDDSPDTAGQAIAGKTVSFADTVADKQKIINVAGSDFDAADSYRRVRMQVSNVDSPPGVLGFHVLVLGVPKYIEKAGHVATVTEVVY